MKIALVHDWLDTWRGGESVLAEFCRMYPEADLYALVDFLGHADREKLAGRRAVTSFLQRVPFARTHFRAFLPLFPWTFRTNTSRKSDLPGACVAGWRAKCWPVFAPGIAIPVGA
jgi:hypothetical protein